ncbi:MAG: aromatic acid exporter family protein [Lactobacillales bacterium]|jgi:uncharacterized membrane protein YgaE (UPF0421/DUF939 family)|nr:aromatic acid exporter family protein [Lactobacillales bacterium]
MRTIKTAIILFICLVICEVLHLGNPMVMCVAAVFATRENMQSSLNFGRARVLGIAVGGILAMVYVSIDLFIINNNIVNIIILPLLAVTYIVVSTRLKNQAGLIGGLATFFMIIFSVPAKGAFIYTIVRVLMAAAGATLAIVINAIGIPREDAEEIEDDKEQIKQLEARIKQLETKISAGK